MSAPSDPDCIFCRIVAAEIPATVVYEDDRTVAFMDMSPAADGHVLVVPRAHAADLWSISPEDLAACAATAQVMAARAREALDAEGVNLFQSNGEAAWQSVFHFHVHVVPRRAGDPLRLPWTPQPGDPDAIAAAAERLRASPNT